MKDNGLSIESEKQKDSFSIFHRLKPQIERTGVGFFIIDKMVNNLGGKIQLESKPGEGTTFKIS